MDEAIRAKTALEKALLAKDPKTALENWANSTHSAQLPELQALKMDIPKGWQHKDIYQHTLQVVENAASLEKGKPDLVLRMAALLHDIAKPTTRRLEKNGVVTFQQHEVEGAKESRKILQRLHYEAEFITKVELLVKMHMRSFNFKKELWTDAAVRRFKLEAGTELNNLIILMKADVTTRFLDKKQQMIQKVEDLELLIKKVEEKDTEAKIRPVLKGEEIMQLLDIPPSKQVGMLLKKLLALKKENIDLSKEEAKKLVKTWHSESKK